MNFNEARRFLRLDKPTAAIRMAAAISHRRVALRYEAEQRDNPDAYDLRTMKPLGTIQSAIANANLARAYGNEASDFFEQSETGIRLTSPSFLSLTDERIEYGTRQIKDKNGNLVPKTDLWYISPLNRIKNHPVTPNLLRALVLKGRTGIVEQLGNLTADEVAQRFQSALATASNHSVLVSRG
ncbi:MAG: hypothetical protein AAB532_01020 [Patescibacteria group bacterium]